MLPRLLLFALILTSVAQAARRPNILFIYADDQPYKTIGCYPEAPKWVRTPNIDALAAQGVRFHRSYLGAWCMPSRAALLTGLLQPAVQTMRMEGKYPGSTYDPTQCRFWPAELRKHGYHTAQIGKWHTGTDTGFGRDWDHQIVWNRPGKPENAGAYYEGQIVTFNGKDQPVPGYATDAYTQWAVDYLQERKAKPDQPWYLWLCYGGVHGPTTPAARHKGTLQGNKVSVPSDIFGPRPDKPAYLDVTQAWTPGPDGQPMKGKPKKKLKNNFDDQTEGRTLDAWVQQVNECNRSVDEGVGRVIEALRASGQFDDTLIIYSADQGFALGEHGCSIKHAPYDANISSPLIIAMPRKLPQGKICKQPVNSPDLVATMLAFAQMPAPWAMHGRDLSALLHAPDTTLPDPTLLISTGNRYGADTAEIPVDVEKGETANVPWWTMMREGHFKYIRNLVVDEMEELYDLEADPEELRNLARDPQHRAQVEKLRATMIDQLRAKGVPFANAMPPVRALP